MAKYTKKNKKCNVPKRKTLKKMIKKTQRAGGNPTPNILRM